MAFTGTIGVVAQDEEAAEDLYRGLVIQCLEEGGLSVFGVPIPVPLPSAELAPMQAEAVRNRVAEGDDPIPIMTKGAVECLRTIDTALPPGANAGVVDPTFPMADVVTPFLDILIEIGISDPTTFILENMDNADLWSDLASCNNKDFSEKLSEIEPNANTDGLPEKLEAVCGFSIPGIDINLQLPSFSFGFDFALGFDLPTFDPFLNFDIQFPALNWVMVNFVLAILDAIQALIDRIGELILKLPEGIPAFIELLIEIIMSVLLIPLLAVLAILGGAILLAAAAIALVKLIIIGIIVAFVGFMIFSGLIALTIARLLLE